MSMLRQVWAIAQREATVELRQKTALGSVVLYAVGATFMLYLGYGQRGGSLSPMAWHTSLWVFYLFTAIAVVGRSFVAESPGRKLYLYTLCNPVALLLGKTLWASTVTVLSGLLLYALFSLLLKNPVQLPELYVANLVLGGLGFSATLTLVSAIVSSSQAGYTLMPVLGFPLLVPSLLLHLREGLASLEGLEAAGGTYLVLSALMAVLSLTLGLVLFPFVWQQ